MQYEKSGIFWWEKKTWRKFSNQLHKADLRLLRTKTCWGPFSRGFLTEPTLISGLSARCTDGYVTTSAHCPLAAAQKTTCHCWCSWGVCEFHPRGPKAPGSPPGWSWGHGSPAQSVTGHRGNSPGRRHLCWAERPENTTTHQTGIIVIFKEE